MQKYFSKKDILIYALLWLFCVYLFKDIIIGGHRLTGTDFFSFYLEMKQFLYSELHNNFSIPFWNPYMFGGMPFWAHFESTIFYPLDFLFWLIAPDKAYGYTMFFHLLIAGVFMYILARSFAIGRAGSFIAAAVFTCNGFIMAILYLGQMCPVQSYIWLPLIIYFTHRALLSKRPFINACMAGIFWGIQILAGAPQDAFYTFIAAFLFLLFNIKLTRPSLNHHTKLVITTAIIFAVGAGISAIQTIPAFELIANSVRTSLDSYEMVTSGSYPPEGIITTIMPNFFGSYTENGFWVNNVPWSIPQQNLYVGILPLFLLFFLSYRDSPGKNILLFATALAIISFFLALGRHTPVYKLAYLLPGFDRFRGPSKIIVLWVFALSLLAGKGMDGLFNCRCSKKTNLNIICLIIVIVVVLNIIFFMDSSLVLKIFSPFILDDAVPNMMSSAVGIIHREFYRFTFIALTISLLIFLANRGLMKKKMATALLCALLLFDLGFVNRKAVEHDDDIYASVNYIKNNLNMSMGKDSTIFRVGGYKSGLGPNIEMYLGYQTVGGFTALFLDRYYNYINKYVDGYLKEGWQYFFYGTHKNSRLMDLLNVKYEVDHNSQKYAFRDSFLPRAFIVPAYKLLPKDEILDYMVSPDFDPKETLLLEENGFHSVHEKNYSSNTGIDHKTAILSYSPDLIALETVSSDPGYLFLSEVFYPGWKAFLDDKPVEILRSNYLFRAIEVPKGQHSIRLVFDPFSIKLGIGVTIFTIFILLNAAIYCFTKKIIFNKKNEIHATKANSQHNSSSV